MRFRSTFKYAISYFTGISKSTSIKKARLRLAFSKTLGLGSARKVLSLVFELLLLVYVRISPTECARLCLTFFAKIKTSPSFFRNFRRHEDLSNDKWVTCGRVVVVHGDCE